MKASQLTRAERIALLGSGLSRRILVLDGATGTALQQENLRAAGFGGAEYEGCNENLVFTRPDITKKVHAGYLAAGCDVVETNTFGGPPLVIDEYKLGHRAEEQNRVAAEIARAACAEFDTKERTRFVAGSIGPTTKAISVTGGIDFDTLSQHFYVQAKGLYAGGADYFLIET